MKSFTPSDPHYEARIRESFACQPFMNLIGASLARIQPGEVSIEMSHQVSVTQQDGFLHAGIVTTLVDNACGYAAYSLMPADSRVLSIEFKVNLLSPAVGERFLAVGKVVRAGKTVSVCAGEVFAYQNGEEKLVAIMQATMMTVR